MAPNNRQRRGGGGLNLSLRGQRQSSPPRSVTSSPAALGQPSSGFQSLTGIVSSGSTSNQGSDVAVRAQYDGNASETAPVQSSADPRNIDIGAGAYAAINRIGSRNSMPARPTTLNNQGQPCDVGLNTYKVKSFPTKKVYQYDVMVVPTGLTKGGTEEIKRVVLDKIWKSKVAQEALGQGWVYDGNKLAWSLQSIEPKRIEVDLDVDRGQESRGKNMFKLNIRLAKQVSFDTLNAYLQGSCSWDDNILEAVTFMDHLMREGPRSKFFGFRRSFFSNSNDRLALGGGIEALKGVYASIRPAYYGPGVGSGLTINVDVSNSTFWVAGPLLQAVLAVNPQANEVNRFKNAFITAAQGDWKRSAINDNLKRLSRVKVFTTHRGNGARDEFVIDKFLPNDVTNYRITTKEGKKISLQTYYKDTYNQYTETGLPVVQMTKKLGPKDAKFNVVVPLNFLRIVEYQRYAFKLDEKQTSNMIRFAVTPPSERLKAIEAGVGSLNWAADPYLLKYGVQISTQRTEVKGRLLPTPDVGFGGGKSVPASQAGQGRWRIDGQKFLTPNSQPIKSWGVCVVSDPREAPTEAETIAFFKNFVATYKNHGGQFANHVPVIKPGNLMQGGELITQIWNATGNQNQMRPQILFFVMPRKDTNLYRMIKKSCDIRYGVYSQCLQARHVKQNQGQYISNVCMKVNAKLGGSTCKANSKIMGKLNPSAATIPTMVMGLDVSHPPPGIADQGSFAAITISMDRTLTRFAAHVNTNGNRVELVGEQVWSGIEGHLQHWIKNVGGGQLPKRLIFIRDGISEGQYQQCIDDEVIHLRNLFKKLEPGNATKFTVIIASKRHHIRFFPSRASGDKNGNPKPGTLVETGVTHPFENNFYLCSHSAIKGTARPLQLHVVLDESNIPSAELQQMLYESAYTYARATTPVSLPPAVYYAHLASNRAIAHVDAPHDTLGRRPDTKTSTSDRTPTEILPLLPLNNQMGIKGGMWYI